MPSRRRALALEVYAFHKNDFYKRGGEEYKDVFMGSKTVEFQGESMRVEFRRVMVCYM